MYTFGPAAIAIVQIRTECQKIATYYVLSTYALKRNKCHSDEHDEKNPSPPGSAFEAFKSHIIYEFAVALINSPTALGRVEQLFQTCRFMQIAEEIFRRLDFVLGPLHEQSARCRRFFPEPDIQHYFEHTSATNFIEVMNNLSDVFCGDIASAVIINADTTFHYAQTRIAVPNRRVSRERYLKRKTDYELLRLLSANTEFVTPNLFDHTLTNARVFEHA